MSTEREAFPFNFCVENDAELSLPDCWHISILNLERPEGDPFGGECRLDLQQCDQCWYLTGMYVPVELRRQHIGTLLMIFACEWCAKQAPELPILLDTRPYGPSAPSVAALRAFYGRAGFERWPDHPLSMVRWPDSAGDANAVIDRKEALRGS